MVKNKTDKIKNTVKNFLYISNPLKTNLYFKSSNKFYIIFLFLAIGFYETNLKFTIRILFLLKILIVNLN